MFFEGMFTDEQGNQYEFLYHLSFDGKEINVRVKYVGWFTKWISISLKHIFDPKKYILKNIRKHSKLSEIFEKLNKEEIIQIKKRIMIVSIKSCEMKPLKNKVDIANLRIKR